LNLTYRRAGLDDLDILADWNRQLIRDEGHANPMTADQLRERMRGWIGGDYRAVLFLESDEPVAYGLYRESEDEIHLRQFYVERNRRRQGIGRRAMETLIGTVWPRDRRLTVEVLCTNEAALAFWRSIGYRDYCLELEIRPEP